MAPARTRKRKSDRSTSSVDVEHRSPIKKRKMGLSVAQKQALIDNLQLEITERARRLRAQYNVQAQQLRSRVEMRVNRIPTALRKIKMGELLIRHAEAQQPRQPQSPFVARPPPVPAKNGASPKPIPRKPVPAGSSKRSQKRLSEEIAGADDKENSVEPMGNPKKKLRGGAAAAEASRVQPGQVLSPTSTNLRIMPRGLERPASPTKSMMERAASPAKSMIARPASPTKGLNTKASSSLLSNMVEKAKATRSAAAATRKVTASSTTGSSAAGTSTRTRKPAVPIATTTASTRGRRKVSQTSDSSEASTATVIKKTTASKAAATKPPPPAKRTVMSTIRSATTKKAPAAKAAAPATSGRTLRKRQV
ncbi:Borealin N terminal-domain-containing protein [Xylariales sp. AK1849]|nr:Borealin N terminal-domain-containing protein [Xylariales sp. AK1849]